MNRILTPTVVRVFRALGLIGLAVSAAIHVSTFLGLSPSPGFFALHAAVFVVFFPAVLVTRRDGLSWSKVAAPAWAKVGAILLVVYAAFNFSRFMGQHPGTVAEHSRRSRCARSRGTGWSSSPQGRSSCTAASRRAAMSRGHREPRAH
jgi:hypothetical protein